MAHDLPLYDRPLPDLADAPLFNGRPVGLMSASHPREAPAVAGDDGLRALLQQHGLRWTETEGRYGGPPERTFLIENPRREHMLALGKALGQESVVYSDGRGHHELLYTTGANAGKFHPAHPQYGFHPHEAPPDYYTALPGKGYLRLHFDQDRLHPAPLRPVTPVPAPAASRQDVAAGVAKALRKAMVQARPATAWAGSYDWHEGHHAHHLPAHVGGVVVPASYFHNGLRKDVQGPQDLKQTHPHTAAHGLPSGPKPAAPDFSGGAAVAGNDQAGKAGTSKAYGRFAAPYGTVDRTSPSTLKFYPLEGKHEAADAQVAHHGYQVYYAGGKHGKPDLGNRNYTTKHLMVYDPEAGPGGDFGETSYTDAWRKTHELAHALTLDGLNQKYGEGRRMGALGKHRTLREAKRAVEWEHLAALKQRELASQIGVHISDEDFNREYNTVLHDAVHRAVTGKFSDPQHEGFRPHAHRVPLDVAMRMLDEAAKDMGLRDEHDLLRKADEPATLDDLRRGVAKAIRDAVAMARKR